MDLPEAVACGAASRVLPQLQVGGDGISQQVGSGRVLHVAQAKQSSRCVRTAPATGAVWRSAQGRCRGFRAPNGGRVPASAHLQFGGDGPVVGSQQRGIGAEQVHQPLARGRGIYNPAGIVVKDIGIPVERGPCQWCAARAESARVACCVVSGSRGTAGQGARVKGFGPDAAQAHSRARAGHQGEQQQGGAHRWSPRLLDCVRASWRGIYGDGPHRGPSRSSPRPR